MSNSIHISKILISENRQRQEFDPEALVDLANSITAHGLMHPPVMRENGDGTLTLIAGERRLRAMGDLWAMGTPIRHNGTSYPPETVPYVTLGELDEFAAEEAELDENLRRKDLTWQEEAAAIARLHSLRLKKAELLGKPHTHRDTAEELVRTPSDPSAVANQSTKVRQSTILAQHLSNPEVSKAKNAREAYKILQRQEESRKNSILAERIGKNFNSSAHSLHHVNCLEWLETCPENSFDVILTDPPYGMGADSFGDGAGRLANNEHHYNDSYESWKILVESLCPLLYRAAKPQAHAYIFCDFDRYHQLKSIMETAGWYVFRTPLVVYKPNSGRVPLPEHGPRRQYEICLYGIKGNRPVTGIYPDVIPCRLEEALSHGAQKPVELYVDLLKRSVRPGDTVLDAFAGSGTIFPAAHQVKVRATGLEISPEYYGMCVKRLNALDEEPELF